MSLRLFSIHKLWKRLVRHSAQPIELLVLEKELSPTIPFVASPQATVRGGNTDRFTEGENYPISYDKVEKILDAALLKARHADKDKLEVLKQEINKQIEDLWANKVEDPSNLPAIWKRDRTNLE